MLKLTNTQKKILKDAIKESVKTGAKVMVTGVALSAAAAMGGPVAGLAAGGTVWAVLTQTKHLSNGFNAGLLFPLANDVPIISTKSISKILFLDSEFLSNAFCFATDKV